MKTNALIPALIIAVTLFTAVGFATETDDGRPHAGPATSGPAFSCPALSCAAGGGGAPAGSRTPGSLTTIFASNNGYAGNMFDITPTRDLIITGIDINTSGSGTTEAVDIWCRDGTCVGFETSSSGWTLFASGTGTGMGTDNPTFIDLTGNTQTFSAGQTYGIYVDLTSYSTGGGTCRYTDGGPTTYSNNDLSLLTFFGKGTPAFSSSTFTYREWNGTIYYNDAGPAYPWVDIKCNGLNSGVTIPQGTNARLDYTVSAGIGQGIPVDIWIVLRSPFGLLSYDGAGPLYGWTFGLNNVFFVGPLKDLNGTALDQTIQAGAFEANIAIDTVPNAQLDMGSIFTHDKVDFLVY